MAIDALTSLISSFIFPRGDAKAVVENEYSATPLKDVAERGERAVGLVSRRSNNSVICFVSKAPNLVMNEKYRIDQPRILLGNLPP